MKQSDPRDRSEDLIDLALQVGVNLSREQTGLLLAHLDAVLQANQKVNLTAVLVPREALLLHVVDSLTAARIIVECPAGPLIDVGSGAGYPGIPLAVVTGRPTVLLEATRKKASFLRDVSRSLRLRDVEVAPVRAEEFAAGNHRLFAVAVARAVAELASLVELVAPLLADGGCFVAFKGVPSGAEIERGDAAAGLVGMRRTQNERLILPQSHVARELVVYEKTSSPQVQLPRRTGVAQRRPFG